MPSIHDADRAFQPADCPECHIIPNVLQAGKNFCVRCPNCGASTECLDGSYDDAVRAWNHVVAELVVQEDLEWNDTYTGEVW